MDYLKLYACLATIFITWCGVQGSGASKNSNLATENFTNHKYKYSIIHKQTNRPRPFITQHQRIPNLQSQATSQAPQKVSYTPAKTQFHEETTSFTPAHQNSLQYNQPKEVQPKRPEFFQIVLNDPQEPTVEQDPNYNIQLSQHGKELQNPTQPQQNYEIPKFVEFNQDTNIGYFPSFPQPFEQQYVRIENTPSKKYKVKDDQQLRSNSMPYSTSAPQVSSSHQYVPVSFSIPQQQEKHYLSPQEYSLVQKALYSNDAQNNNEKTIITQSQDIQKIPETPKIVFKKPEFELNQYLKNPFVYENSQPENQNVISPQYFPIVIDDPQNSNPEAPHSHQRVYYSPNVIETKHFQNQEKSKAQQDIQVSKEMLDANKAKQQTAPQIFPNPEEDEPSVRQERQYFQTYQISNDPQSPGLPINTPQFVQVFQIANEEVPTTPQPPPPPPSTLSPALKPQYIQVIQNPPDESVFQYPSYIPVMQFQNPPQQSPHITYYTTSNQKATPYFQFVTETPSTTPPLTYKQPEQPQIQQQNPITDPLNHYSYLIQHMPTDVIQNQPDPQINAVNPPEEQQPQYYTVVQNPNEPITVPVYTSNYQNMPDFQNTQNFQNSQTSQNAPNSPGAEYFTTIQQYPEPQFIQSKDFATNPTLPPSKEEPSTKVVDNNSSQFNPKLSSTTTPPSKYISKFKTSKKPPQEQESRDKSTSKYQEKSSTVENSSAQDKKSEDKVDSSAKRTFKSKSFDIVKTRPESFPKAVNEHTHAVLYNGVPADLIKPLMHVNSHYPKSIPKGILPPMLKFESEILKSDNFKRPVTRQANAEDVATSSINTDKITKPKIEKLYDYEISVKTPHHEHSAYVEKLRKVHEKDVFTDEKRQHSQRQFINYKTLHKIKTELPKQDQPQFVGEEKPNVEVSGNSGNETSTEKGVNPTKNPKL